MGKFISLARKNEGPTEIAKSGPTYPNFWVDEHDLGIREKHVGKTITATVKLYVHSISKRVEKGDVKYDPSLEVRAIALEDLPEEGVQDMIEDGLKEEQEKDKK